MHTSDSGMLSSSLIIRTKPLHPTHAITHFFPPARVPRTLERLGNVIQMASQTRKAQVFYVYQVEEDGERKEGDMFEVRGTKSVKRVTLAPLALCTQ